MLPVRDLEHDSGAVDDEAALRERVTRSAARSRRSRRRWSPSPPRLQGGRQEPGLVHGQRARQRRIALIVRAEAQENEGLVASDPQRFGLPKYVARHGYVSYFLDLPDRPSTGTR